MVRVLKTEITHFVQIKKHSFLFLSLFDVLG